MRNTVVTAFRITVVALALLVFCFTMAGAAEPMTPPTGHHHGGFLSKILAELKLTSAEQTTINAILASQKLVVQPLITKLKTSLKTDSTLTTYNETAVSTDAATLGTDLGNLIAARLNTEYLIYQALATDPAKQALFASLLAVSKHGHGRFGH
jgi:hypothetical protein